jgi:glutamyl-Q tRNA(Asp) synthetase
MNDYSPQPISYVGRFAPSPTGPLHFGSLVAALASYFDARSNKGTWLVRMEDLDPPREPPGTDALILEQLHTLGLEWDGEVLYQSSRLDAYRATLERLKATGLCFACDCTRPRIKSIGGIYDGRCRNRKLPFSTGLATRVKTDNNLYEFEDAIQGSYSQTLEQDTGDFTLLRKDGLFAYQLAVVVDDADQCISHVVRGYDLLDSTPRQIYLQKVLGFMTPQYAHVPVIVNEQGQKLSKQHFADAIEVKAASKVLYNAMRYLGLRPANSQISEPPAELLAWGIDNWDIQTVPKLATIQMLSAH